MAKTIRLTAPIDGDVLNRHDGTVTPAGLMITVRGEAPAERPVTVTCDGAEAPGGRATGHTQVVAARKGAAFEAAMTLQGRFNTIVASDGQTETSIRVFWDYASVPRYRFSVDDNILFLKDIARGSYRSLFDHWYLAFWQDLHRRYGTKVHINIYYQTDDSVFSGDPFRLPEMPDRYKGEWRDNADWLRLTFHGWQNMPDRPYKDATYEQIAHDYDAVTEQIARFAGEESIGRFTTVHWAEAPMDAVRALRNRGVIGLMGGFWSHDGSLPTTRYYLNEAQTLHLGGRDYWWDAETDMHFVCFDACVNWYSKDQIEPRLDAVGSNAHTAELLELIVHEEYFRSELHWYKPDIQETCERAARWAFARGYKPVFWGDGFYGA